MNVKKQLCGDTLTVTVDGWLDTLTAPVFRAEVGDLDGIKNITLDYGGVEYISSAGLRETVVLYRAVSQNGGAFRILNVSKSVMDVFSMTGFDKKMSIQAKE